MTVTYDPATVSLIVDWARWRGFAPDLAVCIAWGESALDVNAEGDYVNGVPTSHGIYQGNDIHGKPREYWLGYDGAKRSMAFIQDRWRRTLTAQFPAAADEWRERPADFLPRFWAAAQGADPAFTAARSPAALAAGMAVADDWFARHEWAYAGPGGWLMPVNGTVNTGYPYGAPTVDSAGNASTHRGWDFPAPEGFEVRAIRAGVVTYADWYNYNGEPKNDGTGIGIAVFVRDERGVVWRYGHQSATYVYVGQRVRFGETIGLCGATGYAQGSHVHLERHEGGRLTDPAIDLLHWQPPTPPQPPAPPPQPPPGPTPDQIKALWLKRAGEVRAAGEQAVKVADAMVKDVGG